MHDGSIPTKGDAMEAQHTPARWFALLAGAFLAALGVLTLIFASVDWSATQDPAEFLLWRASGWNTVLWMAMGGIGLLASMRVDLARAYGLLAAAVFGLLAVWGFVDSGVETMGIFSIGTAGDTTHAVIAALGLAVGLAPESAERRAGISDRTSSGA
jgi:hypothetical protein